MNLGDKVKFHSGSILISSRDTFASFAPANSLVGPQLVDFSYKKYS